MSVRTIESFRRNFDGTYQFVRPKTIFPLDDVKFNGHESMRVYTCEHDTSPPEGQRITTNQQNILIRSLMISKQKGESSSSDSKGAGEDRPRKRPAKRVLDFRPPAKRTTIGTQQEGSSSRTGERDYQSLTVERLRALLKEKGLPANGRKDELIVRLKMANS